MRPFNGCSSPTMWRMSIDLPAWIGPITRCVAPLGTATDTSWITGACIGPVRCSTRSTPWPSDEAGYEVENRIDEGISAEHADERIDHGARRRFPDGRGATLRAQPLVRCDDGDDQREDDRLADPDAEIAREERLADLAHEAVGRIAEEDGAPDPDAAEDERIGDERQRGEDD